MERFLGGAFARFVLVPLLGVALANFARVLSRRGKGSGQEASRRLRPEDLAVGLDMTVLAIVSLLGLAVERIHAVVTSDSQLIKLLAHKPLDAGGQVKASHLAAISQSADADYASYLVAGFLFTILLFALAAAVERFGLAGFLFTILLARQC